MKMPGSQRRAEIAPIDSRGGGRRPDLPDQPEAPFAPLLAQFTDRAGMMVSPKAAERLGDKFATAPVCAGPFKFVERVPQDRIVVERFPDYWNKDAIHIQRIEFRPIPDATVRLTNLRAGQLDLLERLAPTDVAQVKRDAKLKLESTYELGFQEILFNPTKAGSPVADPKVRAGAGGGDRPQRHQPGGLQRRVPGRATSGSARRTRTTSPSTRSRSATSPRRRRCSPRPASRTRRSRSPSTPTASRRRSGR